MEFKILKERIIQQTLGWSFSDNNIYTYGKENK